MELSLLFSKDRTKTLFNLKQWQIEIIFSVLSFIFIFVSYIIFTPLNEVDNLRYGTVPRAFGIGLSLIIIIVFIVLCVSKKINFNNLILLIFLLGFVIRLTYMLYTNGHTRQYDTWSSNNDAHYDYAVYFYLTGKLPTEHISVGDIYQFYHPPFNASIQGFFMRIFNTLCPNLDLTVSDLEDASIYPFGNLYSSCQILSCFYMFIFTLFGSKLVYKSKMNNESKLISISFICLYPRLVEMSGQLNNDALAIMLSMIAIYFFCKWYFNNKKWLDNILTAIFTGLALYAKLSASIICLGMAVFYLKALIDSILKKDDCPPVKKLILQYVVFLAICAPLGLWWQVYLIKAYNLPFNFVFSDLNSKLFVGTKSYVLSHKPDAISYYNKYNEGILYTNNAYNIFVRFIVPFYPDDFTYGVYCSAFNNYNLLSYALRSSIFGEFSYWYGTADAFAIFSTFFIYMVYFSLIISLVYSLIIKAKFKDDILFALALTLGIIIMYLYLQISMPYGCSMDFRYIVPIIVPIAFLLGKTNDMAMDKVSKKNVFDKIITYYRNISVFFFLFCSSCFYLSAI